MARDFDSFFKELVQERIDETQCPPKEEAWKQIIVQLRIERKKERRKYFIKRFKPIFAAFIAFVVITVLYAIPQTQVMALTNKLIKSIMVITGNDVRVYEKAEPGKSADDYLFGREIDDPRIGEAQKKVHFELLVPEYIPKEFTLSSVDVSNKYEKKEAVSFLYLKQNSDKKDTLEIIQQSFPGDADDTVTIKKDDDTKIEKLIIDGIEYTLVSYEQDMSGILWSNDDIRYEIEGNIGRDDILKIAKSMK
jgi:hypothetical protein